ncbi:hypothetical protein MTQ01_02930 [Streptomyces sp. XM4193]|uniref:hypothetical protein n=1 Tax=Streptomyces sp. XM4193 TaxID=2929782 RepID=UPI001FF980ED|nr:hypothetical protein [Streptomyces sp. XM4193]MCK1794990.1 hypothetical protein [Streptomyces sp. XM4193]
MSEYQYYQFLAVERPLSECQQGELRKLSTRAQITSNRMTNHYEWGDFKGDPVALVERYFDAHLYFANWGSRRLLLRVPSAQVPLKTVLPYCRQDVLAAHRHGAYTVIDMVSEDDGADEDQWVQEAEWDDEEDEGALAELIGIRDELCRGDLRSLAIARLTDGAAGPEPRDSPGRADTLPGPLSASQQALAAFLRVAV